MSARLTPEQREALSRIRTDMSKMWRLAARINAHIHESGLQFRPLSCAELGSLLISIEGSEFEHDLQAARAMVGGNE